MGKTDYLESKIVRHIIGAATFTPPAGLYLALFTSDPGEAGSTANEMTGGSPAYARKPITFGTESGGQASNSAQISVNVPTGTTTHFGIMDAVSGGNMLYSDAFEIPISTVSGTPLVFAAGDVFIQEK